MSQLRRNKLLKHEFNVISKGKKFLMQKMDFWRKSQKNYEDEQERRTMSILIDALRGSERRSIVFWDISIVRSKGTSMNNVFTSSSTNNIREKMSALLSDERRIKERRKITSNRTKKWLPIDHACKIYILTIENNTKKVITSHTLKNGCVRWKWGEILNYVKRKFKILF